MGRFAQKYTDAEKQAIVEAYLDGGLSARQAVTQAKAGKLGDLAPFDMPIASLYHYAKLERKRRAGRVRENDPRSPLERLDDFASRSIGILEYELDRLERKAGPGKELTKDDADQMKRLGQVAREIKALGLNVQPIHGSGASKRRQRQAHEEEKAQRTPDTTGPTLADRMAQDMDRDTATDNHPSQSDKDRDPGKGALVAHAVPASTQGEETQTGGVLTSADAAARVPVPA